MLTASDAFDEAHPRLARLVKRAESRTGSRMLAYRDVARGIGASPSWVRKVLGRQDVGMPGHVILNIFAAYDSACTRWEDEAAIEKQRFMALGRERHAVAESTSERLGLEEGSATPRGRRAARVVPGVVDQSRQRLTPTSSRHDTR